MNYNWQLSFQLHDSEYNDTVCTLYDRVVVYFPEEKKSFATKNS